MVAHEYQTMNPNALQPAVLENATIETGSPDDYSTLAHLHYRAAAPATMVGVLRARIDGLLAGVLVVSMPARNASWRSVAWPDLLDAPSPREALRRLNLQVRCISRVIVAPRFRGLGLATSLVRAYLRSPLTPRTEAIASMGHFHGFFTRAGMQSIPLRSPPGDERLVEALRASGMHHADLMVHAGRQAIASRPELARELRIWVRSRSELRTRARASPLDLALLAAERILPRRIVYVCDHAPQPPHGSAAHLSAAPPPTQPCTRSLRPCIPAAAKTAGPPLVPLIIMLTPAERRACLRSLGKQHPDRRAALLRALHLDPTQAGAA